MMASKAEKLPSVLNHTVISAASRVKLQQGLISSRVFQNVLGLSRSASV